MSPSYCPSLFTRIKPVISILALAIFLATPAKAQVTPQPLPINLHQFFLENNGHQYVTDPTYFGAYAITPHADSLFIGLSAGSPAGSDGALLTEYHQGTLSAVLSLDGTNPITEQGIHDLSFYQDTLYLPGIDPCCNDGWDFGNVYTYNPTTGLVKHRNIPNAIHDFGLWVDDTGIYLGTGAHTPEDNSAYVGNLYHSPDFGQSWEPPQRVSAYRVYDIIKFHNRLYAVANDSSATLVYVSADNGLTWSTFINTSVNRLSRLFIFQDKLLIASSRLLYVVDAQHQLTTYILPPFQPTEVFNIFTADDHGNLYALTEDDQIVTTSDFISWYEVAHFDVPIISLTYWPATRQLVFAEQGETGRILTLDVGDIVSPPLILSPTPLPEDIDFSYAFSPPGLPDSSWDTVGKFKTHLYSLGFQDIYPGFPMMITEFTPQNGSLKQPDDALLMPGHAYFMWVKGITSSSLFSDLSYKPVASASYQLGYFFSGYLGIPENLFSTLSPNGQPTGQDICRSVHLQGGNVTYLAFFDNTLFTPGWHNFYCFQDAANLKIKPGLAYLVKSNLDTTWHLPPPPLGSIDQDDDVDFTDLNLLINQFTSTATTGADLNYDLKTDIFDYNLLTQNF